MQLVLILFAGALFGAGITISGMANPAKVQNFLDLAGQWDPSLAFVMGGGLLVTTPGFYFLLKRKRPLFADLFSLPTRRDIDVKLIVGGALFGIGWGLAGLCPAPALVALLTAWPIFILFALAMAAGMVLHYWVLER